MIFIKGKVSSGYGVATQNLNRMDIYSKISTKMNIAKPVDGTLNIIVEPQYLENGKLPSYLSDLNSNMYNAFISKNEYSGNEWIKFFNCKVESEKFIKTPMDIYFLIMRPEYHYTVSTSHELANRLEIMSNYSLREKFALQDNDIVIIKML